MNYRKFFCLAFVGAFLCALPCLATDIYVAQTAQGADTGADAADAHSVAWLNASANWGTGSTKIGPSGTVHLCGIVSNSITIQASGTAGNPITVFFEPNAKLSAPTWTGNIISCSKSFVTIDGGSNGIIEATANGSELTYSNNSIVAVNLTGNSSVVQNLTVQNLYVNIPRADENGTSGSSVGVKLSGTFGNDIVTNCLFHDMFKGVSVVYYAGCSNITMTHCTAFNCNWGGNAGDANSSSTLNGLTVDHCHFYNWSNWDDALDNGHHNGFYAWATYGWISNLTYTANYVGSGYGADNTSGFYVSGYIHAFKAYDNIFDASDGTSPSVALLDIGSDKTATTNQVLNNTFIGAKAFNLNGVTNATYTELYNNEFYTNRYAITVYYGGFATLMSDSNNIVPTCLSSGGFSFSTNGSAKFYTFAQWRNLGFDTHSTTNNLALTSDWRPQSGSALIGAGMNISSTFTTDYADGTRPETGNWDIGAYEYQPPTSLSAPSGLSIVPQ